MKRLIFIFFIFILCFGSLGCQTKPDVIKITLLKHILKDHPSPNEPGFIEEPIKEFTDHDSISKIMGAIRDNKPSETFTKEMPQYVLRIEYNGKIDSDGHTGSSLLLWLAPEGQKSEFINETEKGDLYTVSINATHVLREILR